MFAEITREKVVGEGSSNINEVIKEISNLFVFFYQQILTYKNIKKKVHKQIYA